LSAGAEEQVVAETITSKGEIGENLMMPRKSYLWFVDRLNGNPKREAYPILKGARIERRNP